MVSFKPETVLVFLAAVVVTSHATIFSRNAADDSPVAEDRTFKVKKLLGKKKNLLGVLKTEPQVYHTLSPIDHYPIWKVHKYKGVEFRPVQVVDIPTSFDYSSVKDLHYNVPSAEPIRIPHAEYGAPVVDYNAFSGVVKPEEPILTYHHGGKLKGLLALLSKLKALKSWKLGLKHGAHGVSLPEVHDIPVKGLDNLNFQVPELPPIDLSSYSSAITSGPYVKVQVASPAPVTYVTPEYQPQYQYQYPAQYAPQYTYQYPPQSTLEPAAAAPDYQQLSYPVHAPAPFYGPPQLFDSYGTPLPADAYSSASSNQVLSFAVPENATQIENRVPEGISAEYNDGVNVSGTVQVPVELPKFLPEDGERQQQQQEEGIDMVDRNNQQTQINN